MTTRFLDVVDLHHRVGLLGHGNRQRKRRPGGAARARPEGHRPPHLSLQPHRRAGAGDDRRRHHHGRHQGCRGRADQRPVGVVDRRLRLRPAQPDHGHPSTGRRRGGRHRARSGDGRSHPLQGRADPRRLPGHQVRGRPTAVAQRPTGLRAVLLRRRGRQRLVRGALRPALLPLRRAHPAALRRDRLGEPARPGAGDRRSEREDRGLLRGRAGNGRSRATRACSSRRPTSPTSC